MPPLPFVDISRFDLSRIEFGPEEIRKCNPHRFEMELLTRILAYRPEVGIVIGEARTGKEDFWVRGHIPGRPLFPGVLMIESAAQLCSFYWRTIFPDNRKFFGFAGIDATRFRGVVHPGNRLILVGKSVAIKPRRAIFDTQGFVEDKMVFETRITGMPF